MVHPDISELRLGKIEDERQREREISEKSIVKKVPDQEDVGSGSDSEDDAGDAVYTEPTSKTRQTLLNERFKALITKKREMITEEDIRDAIKRTDNEDLSMSNIIAKQDSTSIIHDPREYQLELFEKAKNNNIIAVLDTGSGKTLIAVLLIKHIIKEELENRRARKPHRISFFLVDSVALVYQQAAVLNANIDQPINKFCGAMETDLWSKETWENHFKKNMIIVCTAEVLQQCLLHSYIKMDQINLLIFDEAHHAKKGHPYARILKDFYFQPGLTSRPKLFGMTASPVDAKVGVFKAASALESILDSRILTTSNPDLLRQTIAHPLEETWVYSKLGIPFETDLYKKLYSLVGDISVVQKLFRSAIHLSTILGSWCTDLVLSRNLGDEVLPKLEGQAAKEKATDEEIKRIRAANEIVRKKKVPDPSANLENLSPKTRLLVEKLSSYFKRPTDSKCIVFVEERHTAMVLNELFSRVRTPYLYPGFLVGVRSQDFVDAGISHRKQVLTLMRFRKGEINCLFATSVAEEGLDIPDCNVVIRYTICTESWSCSAQ